MPESQNVVDGGRLRPTIGRMVEFPTRCLQQVPHHAEDIHGFGFQCRHPGVASCKLLSHPLPMLPIDPSFIVCRFKWKQTDHALWHNSITYPLMVLSNAGFYRSSKSNSSTFEHFCYDRCRPKEQEAKFDTRLRCLSLTVPADPVPVQSRVQGPLGSAPSFHQVPCCP